MKAKFLTIGIALAIAFLLLTQPSLCQIGLPSSQKSSKDCFFCADSLEYAGIVKLYAEYNAQIEINNDFKLRFDLLDKSYLECRESLDESVNRLELLNQNRDSLLIKNKDLYLQTTDYSQKLKSWKIFGVSVSGALIGVITFFILTN